MTHTPTAVTPRAFDRTEFDRAYDEVVLGNDFFEESEYYHRYRDRYRRTLDYLCRLELPRTARVLEVGGGQMALLLGRLFRDQCVLADVNPAHAAAVEKFGLRHVTCDLLRDDLPVRDEFDLLVLCEVIEHVPIPPHQVFEKMARWLRPGGYLFLTTPNVYRLRNTLRLILGREVFCNFFYPERGHLIGHFLEYSAPQMTWQLQRAGLEVLYADLVQLSNQGSERLARLTRPLVAPLLWARPLWRDNLVVCARRPSSSSNIARDPMTG